MASLGVVPQPDILPMALGHNQLGVRDGDGVLRVSFQPFHVLFSRHLHLEQA